MGGFPRGQEVFGGGEDFSSELAPLVLNRSALTNQNDLTHDRQNNNNILP
jgi:hypothetical protein